jgi:hypothetical protein
MIELFMNLIPLIFFGGFALIWFYKFHLEEYLYDRRLNKISDARAKRIKKLLEKSHH